MQLFIWAVLTPDRQHLMRILCRIILCNSYFANLSAEQQAAAMLTAHKPPATPQHLQRVLLLLFGLQVLCGPVSRAAGSSHAEHSTQGRQAMPLAAAAAACRSKQQQARACAAAD
jgi:hypothetical protein